GYLFATPHHYMVWTSGNTLFTSHVIVPVLVDAANGQVTAVVRPPWYRAVLAMSQPLHFGDYGGLPLKILWVLLDLLTIVVLSSGLYLWFARRQATDARIANLAQGHRAPEAVPDATATATARQSADAAGGRP